MYTPVKIKRRFLVGVADIPLIIYRELSGRGNAIKRVANSAMAKAIDKMIPATNPLINANLWFADRNTMRLSERNKIGVDTGRAKNAFKKAMANPYNIEGVIVKNKEVRFNYQYEYDAEDKYGVEQSNIAFLFPNKSTNKGGVHVDNLALWVSRKLLSNKVDFMSFYNKKNKNKRKQALSIAFAISKSWQKHGRKPIASRDAFDIRKNQFAQDAFFEDFNKNIPEVIENIKKEILKPKYKEE
jgi:hypothetical protein